MISNFRWLFSNPIDLKSLRKDIWAWISVPHTKEVLYQLLSILERHNVASTFFISGVCAKQNKDEILRIKDAGHEIGLHGYRHVPYDMPYAEIVKDMSQAISVFKEIGVDIKGFRAPWLIANEDAYIAAQMLDLKYVSNIRAKKVLQRFDQYNLVELPIYLDDHALLQENAVDILLKSSETGRVFEFHLLYARRSMRVLDDFLNKIKFDTCTLSQIAEGREGIGLSFDIAYLNRLELLKKLLS
jgi:peptidoglycan/xylan/chitin deacetylase (PgdA/CDA1 family)